jgi:hypothetical protein
MIRHPCTFFFVLLVLGIFQFASAAGLTVDFEDLSLPSDSYEKGVHLSGSFTSHGATFNNDYNSSYDSWSGWAYSSTTDVATPGYTNQYSAFTGSGDNSPTYAVAYDYAPGASTIELPAGYRPASMKITNTTYAALAIRDGDDGFGGVRQFGINEQDGGDYFLLQITGLNSSNQAVGTIPFYLADYRNLNGAQDQLVTDWTTVDLSSLPASTVKLSFGLSSTDNGDYGMNTPAYFAMDNLVLRKPGDFNLDGHVDARDIKAMLAALTNLNGYQHGNNSESATLMPGDMMTIGDLNGDHKINNADLQDLLNRLNSGGGSTSVPEPAAWVLAILVAGGWRLTIPRHNKRRSAELSSA